MTTVSFSRHAIRRCAERGADVVAIRRDLAILAPRLAPFSGYRLALLRRGHPIPVVRPTPGRIEVITVLAEGHRVVRGDTIPVVVSGV